MYVCARTHAHFLCKWKAQRKVSVGYDLTRRLECSPTPHFPTLSGNISLVSTALWRRELSTASHIFSGSHLGRGRGSHPGAISGTQVPRFTETHRAGVSLDCASVRDVLCRLPAVWNQSQVSAHRKGVGRADLPVEVRVRCWTAVGGTLRRQARTRGDPAQTAAPGVTCGFSSQPGPHSSMHKGAPTRSLYWRLVRDGPSTTSTGLSVSSSWRAILVHVVGVTTGISSPLQGS